MGRPNRLPMIFICAAWAICRITTRKKISITPSAYFVTHWKKTAGSRAYAGLGEAYWQKFEHTHEKHLVTDATKACQVARSPTQVLVTEGINRLPTLKPSASMQLNIRITLTRLTKTAKFQPTIRT